MSNVAAPADSAPIHAGRIPGWIIVLLAFGCGLSAANLYYAQPLVGPIAAAVGLSPGAAGLIVTMAQVGYCAGLFFIVPLADLVENRRLVISALAVAMLGLIGAGTAFSAHQLLTASLFIGLGSVSAQILVPYAAHMASDESRGRVVGKVVSGLLLGIMLARPAASLVASFFGWHAIFLLSAVLLLALCLTFMAVLPPRRPAGGGHYGHLLLSMARLLRDTPVLRRRAAYQAVLFGSFSLFWTAVPLEMAVHYGISQRGIALFALAGVAGAVAAPIAGHWADRGRSRLGTLLGLAVTVLGFALPFLPAGLTGEPSWLSLGLLLASALLIDMGVSGNLVFGQRAIFSLGAELRGRLNGLFLAMFFVGGATGSAVGAWAFAAGGWHLAALIGLGATAAALLYSFTERAATHSV
ncbi:MFS transporter [Radicibacter daui]|uniref:MFS transporter n=1 Tax=Radicibacter daui TaxID=3064829 RepID=UPI004046ED3B